MARQALSMCNSTQTSPASPTSRMRRACRSGCRAIPAGSPGLLLQSWRAPRGLVCPAALEGAMLDHIGFAVTDYGRSLAFYKKAHNGRACLRMAYHRCCVGITAALILPTTNFNSWGEEDPGAHRHSPTAWRSRLPLEETRGRFCLPPPATKERWGGYGWGAVKKANRQLGRRHGSRAW